MVRRPFFDMPGLFLRLQRVVLLSIVMTLVLTVRPSVSINNYRYYFSYWQYVFLIIGVFYVMYFIFVKILALKCDFIEGVVLHYTILPILTAFLLLWIIAFLDTKFHIRTLWSSFIRAVKLFVYSYPFV